jgi:hypothetical protein
MFIHGQRRTKTYKSWAEMIQRCSNPNRWQYKYYGGKGIKVCEEWKSFEAFYADMGDRPDGTSLDRIDPDKHYDKQNCRWATKVVQQNNRSNNRRIEYKGVIKTMSEWAREFNIKVATLHARLKYGWSIEKSLTTKVVCSNERAGRL